MAYNFKPVAHYQVKSYRIWNAMIDAKAGKGMRPHTSNCVWGEGCPRPNHEMNMQY